MTLATAGIAAGSAALAAVAVAWRARTRSRELEDVIRDLDASLERALGRVADALDHAESSVGDSATRDDSDELDAALLRLARPDAERSRTPTP